MSEHPPVLVTACCDPEHGKAKEYIFEHPSVPGLIIGPHHIQACAKHDAIALLSARYCAELKSYRAALSIAQASMQVEYSSLMNNGTWELVDLPPDRVVVNNMYIYKVKSYTMGDVSSFKTCFIAKGCSQRVGLD
jgi:hypothetical protein